MKLLDRIPRHFLELVAAIAGAGTVVGLALPMLAPAAGPIARAALCVALTALLSAPVIAWRMRRSTPRIIPRSTPACPHRQISWPNATAAVATLAVGMAVAFFAAARMSMELRRASEVCFERLADRVASDAERRLYRYGHLLRGVQGLYVSSKSVERGEFNKFISSYDLATDYPGALGVTFVQRVPRSELGAFVIAERADEAPVFTVPLPSDGPECFITKFVQPSEPNRFLWGADLADDPLRREALENACLTGESALSCKLMVGQPTQPRPGCIFALAIYCNGTNPATPQERHRDLVGWVCVYVAFDSALAGVADGAEELIDIELHDHPRAHAAPAAGAAFHTSRLFAAGGRAWSVSLVSRHAFDAGQANSLAVVIGAGGALLSTLLAFLVLGVGSARVRAQALADDMTADLAAAKARAEDALRESDALRRTLDEHSIVSVADARGRILSVNDRFCAISGYSREELLGQDHRMLNSGHQPKAFWVHMWKTIAAGNAWRGDVCNRAKSGSLYWVDSIIAPFRGSDGKIEKYVSIRTDITQAQRVQTLIRQSEVMLRETGKIAGVGGWSLDVASGVLQWTEQTRAIHEVSEDFVPTVESAVDYYAPHARPLIKAAVERGIQTGEPWDLELPFITARGRSIWVRAVGQPERKEGRVVRLYGAFQDITDRKRAEVDLITARGAAEAASRAKSEFLANMSHEIRTPLTAILGFADIMREECASNAAVHRLQAIDTIKNAGTHLMTVINDILDLSKIEADKMTVECIPTSIVSVLQEIESLMRPRAIGKGVALAAVLATPLPERIVSDPTRLRQILMNLAGNAVKFTEAGHISIQAAAIDTNGQQRLVIDVIDTGPGMTPQQASHLFAAFGQADGTVTRKHGGTGLGLTISRRLAGLMGGTVTLLRTQPGEGSCFRVDLPLQPVPGSALVSHLDAVAESPASQAPAQSVMLSGRLLLAEDGIDNQRLISYLLRKAGLTVDIAENGLIALRMIEQSIAAGNPFDLLLTDMQMPEMDGYTLARTLRAGNIPLPIVALTAHAMAEDRQRCMDAGCDDYATKPIDRSALLATCARWIASRTPAPRAQA